MHMHLRSRTTAIARLVSCPADLRVQGETSTVVCAIPSVANAAVACLASTFIQARWGVHVCACVDEHCDKADACKDCTFAGAQVCMLVLEQAQRKADCVCAHQSTATDTLECMPVSAHIGVVSNGIRRHI